jgi:quercetin dioxygenase-like cupin family protein
VHDGEFLFLYVLAGGMTLRREGHGEHQLAVDDSCVVPAGVAFWLDADADCELLDVRLPGARGV